MPDRRVTVQIPKPVLWAFGVLLLGPWLVLGAWLTLRAHPTAAAAVVSATPTEVAPGPKPVVSPSVTVANPGPWGDLLYTRILIEPPEEFVLDDYTRTGIREWWFKGYSATALAKVWDDAGLSPAQRAFVDDPTHREEKAGGIVIRPDREFILGLTPAARGKIYRTLGEFPENMPQYNPFRLRASMVADWLDRVDIPPEAIALTKQLYYSRGTATCFSDEAIVLPSIPDAAQRVRYIKALSRKSALLIELKVNSGQNVDPLVEYWGRGGRSKDLRPLLQSLARRPEGGTIDIMHLVPRFVRLLVYTYPLPSEKAIDANHDCHWTSFNFQNELPDERFSNIDYVGQVLPDQYYRVLGPPLLGDIIMFVRNDGVVLHSCVYIADDIVFTKNGPAFSVPWLLSPLADVQAFYADGPGVELRRYRAKNL